MSLSSIELWQRIAAEGLASPMQCRSWAGEVAKLLPAAETADGLKVLQTLIDIGKLTKYQAKVLAGQSSEPLKRGPWHVLTKVKQPLWQGWLEITKIDTSKGDQPPPRWARWLTMSELNSLQSSAPSLPRGIQLANIRADHLQAVEMPELIDGELQLQVHPVAGSSLAELFATTKPATELVLQIIQQAAAALAAMHEKQVVHGRVTPDRIFWDDSEGATLVRDPISVWTAGVDPAMTGILGEQLHGLQIASFLAPEFLAPKQPPSFGSDMYALGATWWWLLVGKPPAEGKSVAATLGAAAEAKLDFEGQVQNLPEPWRICLERCLAKNPSARFANASQLCQALEAAVRSVAKGMVRPSKASGQSQHVVAEVISQVNPVSQPAPQPLTAQPVAAQPIAAQPIAAQPATVSATAVPVESTQRSSAQSPVKPASTTRPTAPQATEEKASPAAVPPSKAQTTAPQKSAPQKSAPPKTAPPKTAPTSAGQPKSAEVTAAQPTAARPTVTEMAAAQPTASQPTHTTSVAVQPEKNLPEEQQASDSSRNRFLSGRSSDEAAVPANLVEPVSSVADVAKAPSRESTKPNTTRRQSAEAKTSAPASAAGKKPSRRRTQRKSKMPLFIIAGFGFVALLLGILKLSGALESTGGPESASKGEPFKPPMSTGEPKLIIKDPLLEQFRIVDSKEALWAPPSLPEPLALDLLPPGAQWYVALRPAEILTDKNAQALYETLQKQFQLDNLLGEIVTASGQPLDSIASVVVAFYNAAAPEQFPVSSLRVELVQAQSLEQLKKSWKATGEAVVGQEKLYLTDSDQAFFVPHDRSSDAIKEFSCGPAAIIKEAAELGGSAAPLSAQLKLLHGKASRLNQLVLLGSPRYLFTEGRGLTRQFPARLRNLLEPVLSKDARAALLQINLADRCYWELQLMGATDADTPRLISKLSDRASGAAAEIENWFVSQTPHPYWRALAFRFPQMIRTWREYARFGVEDGIGLANGYLPVEAAANLLVGSWIATQEASTIAGQLAQSSGSTAPQPATLSPEEILNKPIRLSFDQEPIERALALVGDEANSGVPAASQLRFELDGAAFERAGITRNQQLREFKVDNQPARNALTDIAKRGNPVTTVKDTRDQDQRLIWVVKDDPQNAGKKMVSLTTRDAAMAAGIALPVEFAPQ